MRRAWVEENDHLRKKLKVAVDSELEWRLRITEEHAARLVAEARCEVLQAQASEFAAEVVRVTAILDNAIAVAAAPGVAALLRLREDT